ncbi:ATP-binding cassette sub-family C member Sur isoform X2 [Amyelois transitella]|nr:ATP-binding cassette sub-family C member Sur isoform X2 [Amyelois transitella]XP_060810871.1 ATP-binding cassette sub-family C member Sur isoform X2 [Amyelois transitella]
MVWPNFYIAGVLKLISDLISVVPPLGLAIILQFIEGPLDTYDVNAPVIFREFFSNGYIILVIVTMALITQAILSQNSTHMVTVEGIRLKTGLQGMLFDKCMRLAPWSTTDFEEDEESPLLHTPEEAACTPAGVLTNLMSQDTYNIMSCVWICHYIWAIPLKVIVILYLLYTKLGISAIIGTAVSVTLITPLQFYIGKKLSDNSKDIAKCTDHRLAKITEILQGINVIKLYVWEDLFKEKILNLREVELKLLNKDSIYWSFLTFTTQTSTILVTVVTFTVYYFLENNKNLTAVNVFAGLALFNQLTVPLLILPVTVLMVIQAKVSTQRIHDFLDLPESNNVKEDVDESLKTPCDIFNEAFIDVSPEEKTSTDQNDEVIETEDQFSDEENSNLKPGYEYLARFRNAAFSWGMKNEALLEIDDLDIPTGKLIMVVGETGSGKSSLLSAILGEMYLERGDVNYHGRFSTWYSGQPPWLLEGSVRDNIVMNGAWCQQRYARVLRATGLRPDLQLLPDGDSTHLGSHGAPLSGGQRVRVCLARALYSNACLLALDEPLAALDAALARHVVARALVPAARSGRTVIVATNRLELMHYADLIIAMEDGRVCEMGRAGCGGEGALARWAQIAGSARAAAARCGAGPPGGSARERDRLRRALTKAKFQRTNSDDTTLGISEAAGAHLLAEVPARAAGSWRRVRRVRTSLTRQLSSPPPSLQHKWRREVRRAVSADASDAALRREASLLRRLFRPRPHRTLARWTPRTLRRLLSNESDANNEEMHNNEIPDETTIESAYTSIKSNGMETHTVINTNTHEKEKIESGVSELPIWWEYGRACRWWSVAFWVAAGAAQALALMADYWLTRTVADNAQAQLEDEQMWRRVQTYCFWSGACACAGGAAQAAGAAAGARARRRLHEQLLHATLHAPLRHHHTVPAAQHLHRFSADIQIVDKRLPIAITRWAQLALLCGAAMLVNAVVAPWSLLAMLPALFLYFGLQTIYLCNARELQRMEAQSASRVVSAAAETSAGGASVRAGRLQAHMRAVFQRRLDANHNALLLINAANRWLGLAMDLVGACSVSVSLCVAVVGGSGAAAAGLAGAYSLLLPAYLAHLAKCRADLHLQLAAVERIRDDTNVPQEDYRDDCPLPSDWQRNGKIEFENVSIQYEPGTQPVLTNINLSVTPGQKIAICGRSGSGKSSLLLSCAGATFVSSGRVVIDDQDSARVPLRTLRHRIVVLPQEATMFSGTLRENLDPLAVHTDEEIWQSLRTVGLYEFVSAQPAGLECSVGKSRCGWSGGRAARACGARAALHAGPAAALLLDEPAAALDAHAERALLAALANNAPNTTILTVAHRIASVRNYDRAIVLEDGHIIEQGEVTALLAQPSSRLARMLAAAHYHT